MLQNFNQSSFVVKCHACWQRCLEPYLHDCLTSSLPSCRRLWSSLWHEVAPCSYYWYQSPWQEKLCLWLSSDLPVRAAYGTVLIRMKTCVYIFKRPENMPCIYHCFDVRTRKGYLILFHCFSLVHFGCQAHVSVSSYSLKHAEICSMHHPIITPSFLLSSFIFISHAIGISTDGNVSQSRYLSNCWMHCLDILYRHW